MTTLGDLLGTPEKGVTVTVDAGVAEAARQMRVQKAEFNEVGVKVTVQRLTLIEFVNRVNPKFIWHKHNLLLANVLQRIIDGYYGQHARIIINMPPRHGKTELVSKLFAAYWLYCFPDEWVGLSTYVAELSAAISSTAQSYFLTAGGKIDPKHSASRHWETEVGGGMWAAGVGGPITGKGFNLGIIDDPIKNAEEANSETIGDRNWEWYQSTFYTREAFNHTCIIVMNTRWPGPGDLVGRLFEVEEQARDDEDTDSLERWHCVVLQAIYDPDDFPEIPPSCTKEADWRLPGQALFPERYNEKRLKKIKKISGSYYWTSLYQQNPKSREGNRFKRSWFKNKIITAAPPSVHKDIRYWDFGGGENRDNDPTCGTKVRRVSPTMYIIMDCTWGKWSADKRDQEIRKTAERDGKRVTQWGMQEPGSAGKDQMRAFRSLLVGFDVHTERLSGEKEIRGDPFQAACEAGFVYLLKGAWNNEFLDELVTLWNGKHDDRGETASAAFNKLSFLYRRKRKPPPTHSSHSYT